MQFALLYSHGLKTTQTTLIFHLQDSVLFQKQKNIYFHGKGRADFVFSSINDFCLCKKKDINLDARDNQERQNLPTLDLIIL